MSYQHMTALYNATSVRGINKTSFKKL